MQCGLPTGSQAGPTVPPAGRLSSRLPNGHSNPGGAWGAGYLGVRRAAARGAHGGPRPGTGCQGEEGHACPDTDGPAGVPSACSPGTHPHAAPRTQPRRHPTQPRGHTHAAQAAPRQAPTKSGGPCSGLAQAMAPAAPHQLLSPHDQGAAGPSPLGPPTPDRNASPAPAAAQGREGTLGGTPGSHGHRCPQRVLPQGGRHGGLVALPGCAAVPTCLDCEGLREFGVWPRLGVAMHGGSA